VYDRTAELFVHAVGTTIDPRFETAIDRAALDAFAETVLAHGAGSVLDVGCGPGRATAYLAGRGLDVSGVDLSDAMLDQARAAHPHLQFGPGTLTDLPVDDRSLVGACYWYSIIYTPPSELGPVWAELGRALQPGGTVVIGFQCGDNEPSVRTDVHGSGADLVAYRHAIDDVAASLEQSGFNVTARICREPELEHESTAQGFILARR
jgi:SAM-dependent methyltransferase